MQFLKKGEIIIDRELKKVIRKYINAVRSRCDKQGDETISIRFLTRFGMTLCVRLLHGACTEKRGNIQSNDGK